MKHSIEIGGVNVGPGEQKTVVIPLAAIPTHQDVEMTVHVINGRRPGPCLFVSAAIHGDELNGVEIIRRLLKQKQLSRLKGTLICIPIVNIHGFINHNRYLPDGRDLNRSFPGSNKGSLASRMANNFLCEIVKKCSHGIDLHTGARHRDNLPQIRADLTNSEAKAMSEAFSVPVVIDSKIRDGSLRQAAGDLNIPVLLYEAGEALRFDEVCIRAGVRGILNVMRHLQMLTPRKNSENPKQTQISENTSWVRASNSGVLRTLVPLGAKAAKGSVLGVISDPLGESEYKVLSPDEGIVIGRTNLPLCYEGDALFHLAFFRRQTDHVLDRVEEFQDSLEVESSMTAPTRINDAPIL